MTCDEVARLCRACASHGGRPPSRVLPRERERVSGDTDRSELAGARKLQGNKATRR